MQEKIEKARKLAIEKWGEKDYQEVKYIFDKANQDEGYMDAIDAFIKNPKMNYIAFYDIATID